MLSLQLVSFRDLSKGGGLIKMIYPGHFIDLL